MGWREDVVRAVGDLGGEADLRDIYREIRKIRPGKLSRNYEATIRQTIEANSSDSKVWRKGSPDLFRKVGRGRWALRAGNVSPRIAEVISRVSRDDILEAIHDLDNGTLHPFADSIRYDLVYEDKRYPPKAVTGLAARRQLGRSLTPDEFSGGIDSQCFKALAEHGFRVVEKQRARQPASTGPLPGTPAGAVWVEMTKTAHEHGGPGWEFGTCLWSPSTGSDGRDTYATMREAQVGDLVIHCNDSALVGSSFVEETFKELEQPPPKPGAWAGRDRYYRVELRGYTPFARPVPLAEFLRSFGDGIRDDIESNDPFKYPFILEQSGNLKTVQGGYLTRCTPVLYQFFRSAVGERGDVLTAPAGAESDDLMQGKQRSWAIALGEGGRLWNECQELGIIAIGWDYLGDLQQYESQAAITEAIIDHDHPEAQPTNQSLCCWQFAHDMRVGDYIVAKIGRSRVLGVGTVTSDYVHDTSRTEYHHTRRVKWLRARTLEVTSNAQLPTKTLTDVTDYAAFMDFVTENYLTEEAVPSAEPERHFSVEEALEGLFMDRPEFEGILEALREKKNVILQGPPGVGKTFIAKRLAWALLRARDESRVAMVQFHQSYAYEDFVQGWRPSSDGGFELRNGVFYEFCNRARMDRSRPYVFIIDEINRGNLSRILGELMMLIEPDKRGAEYAIPLTYSEAGERFSVPENLHLLGLMNTADRSLAMVDYALRRRFRFVDLRPRYDHPAFREHLEQAGASPAMIDAIIKRMTALNTKIEADHKNLGRGFRIGHSFFCLGRAGRQADESWYQEVVDKEICPLLEEYWFDRRQTAAEWIASLRADEHPDT